MSKHSNESIKKAKEEGKNEVIPLTTVADLNSCDPGHTPDERRTKETN